MLKNLDQVCAGVLFDSGEIEHLAELLCEHTTHIRDTSLSEEERSKLQRASAAAVLARALREAIHNVYGEQVKLESLRDIHVFAYQRRNSLLGECLADALRLSCIANSEGLNDGDIWRLRCRLEQIAGMAYWREHFDLIKLKKKGAVPPSVEGVNGLAKAMGTAFKDGVSSRKKAIAAAGGKSSAAARREDLTERDTALCEAGRRLLEAGRPAHSIASTLSHRAEAGGLTPKRIREILRAGGVLPDSPRIKKGK